MIFVQYNRCQSISYEFNYSYELIKSHYIIVSIRNNRLTKIVRFFLFIIMNSFLIQKKLMTMNSFTRLMLCTKFISNPNPKHFNTQSCIKETYTLSHNRYFINKISISKKLFSLPRIPTKSRKWSIKQSTITTIIYLSLHPPKYCLFLLLLHTRILYPNHAITICQSLNYEKFRKLKKTSLNLNLPNAICGLNPFVDLPKRKDNHGSYLLVKNEKCKRIAY